MYQVTTISKTFQLPQRHMYYTHEKKFTYGTAQLQNNVRTHPRRILHAFQTHPAHVPDVSYAHPACILDASCIWRKRAWQLHKSCCSFIAKFYTRKNVPCARSGCVPDVFQMRITHFPDVCERYLGADL